MRPFSIPYAATDAGLYLSQRRVISRALSGDRVSPLWLRGVGSELVESRPAECIRAAQGSNLPRKNRSDCRFTKKSSVAPRPRWRSIFAIPSQSQRSPRGRMFALSSRAIVASAIEIPHCMHTAIRCAFGQLSSMFLTPLYGSDTDLAGGWVQQPQPLHLGVQATIRRRPLAAFVLNAKEKKQYFDSSDGRWCRYRLRQLPPFDNVENSEKENYIDEKNRRLYQ